MKIAIYHRHLAPDDLEALHALVANLNRHGIDTRPLADGDSTEGCDFLLSVGGDGTLLSCVQFVHADSHFPPIMGINFGHLGFLTTVGRDQMDHLADDLLDGRYTLEERSLMQAGDTYALNEVFVHRSEEASLLRTQVHVDGLYVATYAGDGVIVATPTGSTAYSLSCGGPILTPDSRCIAITPISAHTLTLRPIIVPDTARIELHTDAGRHILGLDSRRQAVDGPTTLTLSRAPFSIRLVRTAGQNFFSAIRDKLMWGTEIREK